MVYLLKLYVLNQQCKIINWKKKKMFFFKILYTQKSDKCILLTLYRLNF